MNKTFTCTAALCALLTACSDGGYARSPMTIQGEAPQDDQYLAHEHQVTVDVPEESVETAFEAAIQACRTDRESTCAVLDSELTKGEIITANIRARLKASGVEPLITLAAGYGTLETRSTHSEDLAKPIVDGEKHLAMLDAYMADLVRLRQQSRNDVDALIKVTAEIAKTQSDIESLKGENAQLRQRVDLQILRLHFISDRSQSYLTPIKAAFRDFWRDLASGVAQAISGLALLLPWLVILLPLGLLFRYLWRKLR